MATTLQLVLTLYLGIILVFAVKTASSIECYSCNSVSDFRCSDPFEYGVFPKINCSEWYIMRGYPHLPNDTEPTACRKIVQTVSGISRYIRGCGYVEEDKSRPSCYRRAGTFDITVTFCHCYDPKEACNVADSPLLHGTGLRSSLVMFLLFSVPTFGFYLQFRA